MYKNYLTHQFAINFDRMCSSLQLEPELTQSLQRSSHNMVYHFTEALKPQTIREESRHFHLALAFLAECKRLLDEAGVEFSELRGCHEVLLGRLTRLCRDDSEQTYFVRVG
ncbi:MAG: hypothetical protein A2428_06980 [Bdellovibrionales bacterium RIFOXYC1_FULL_54_43]|nr:MAG: hypothetical protein A2428_06980 [Bdellovibrionales bacterium RIFOXYC1_FULL_54_43]OFZ85012.1 MAG: hypothetical protein A2603_04040 [Bdellovibrionales bacterium RIFOXYD1_FULL_55_31]HLE01585.1 hypothetical protein [Bdellovibrionota bacterium]